MKIAQRITACLFVAFLVISLAINIILPDIIYSDSEKRELSAFPKLNAQTVIDGAFMSEFDTYASDQFFARDNWVQGKGMFDYLLGNRKLNGVYLADGRYMRDIDVNSERLDDNIAAIKALAEKSDVPVTLMIAPEAISIYSEKLPSYAAPADLDAIVERIKNELGESVRVVYPKDVLKAHKAEDVYFKTDHHWTMLGAYYAYNELRGIKTDNKPTFIEVANNFRGSMVLKAGVKLPWDELDKIYVPDRISNDNFAVVVNRGYGDEDGVMFDTSALSTTDKYRYFQGGDMPLMAIGSTGEGSALVVKDSFCNTLLPYLARDYKTTYVTDLRYNRQSQAQYARDMGVDEIILVYGLDSLCNEYSIAGLANATTR